MSNLCIPSKISENFFNHIFLSFAYSGLKCNCLIKSKLMKFFSIIKNKYFKTLLLNS